jgi:hypothetical protein
MSSSKAILPKPWAWAYGAALHRVCEDLDRRLAEGQPFIATAAELSRVWHGRPVKGAPDRALKLRPATLWRKYYYRAMQLTLVDILIIFAPWKSIQKLSLNFANGSLLNKPVAIIWRS